MNVTADRHEAVFMNAGSYVMRPKSSSSTLIWRRSMLRIVPSVTGISYCRPVRLSVTESVAAAAATPPSATPFPAVSVLMGSPWLRACSVSHLFYRIGKLGRSPGREDESVQLGRDDGGRHRGGHQHGADQHDPARAAVATRECGARHTDRADQHGPAGQDAGGDVEGGLRALLGVLDDGCDQGEHRARAYPIGRQLPAGDPSYLDSVASRWPW